MNALARYIFLALLVLCGCATTPTVEDRKQEKYGAYSQLSPEMRALVDQGKIAVGMPMDAVYIAWGKPSEVAAGESVQGPLSTWIYYGTYLHEHRYWDSRRWYAGTRYYYAGPTMETEYVPRGFKRGEVVFQNGAVREWRAFPQPPN